MKILIIRSCERDMMLAQLCYLTAVKHNVADRYIFFHEVKNDDNLPLLNPEFVAATPNVLGVKRSFCDNFGGELNILSMLKSIKENLPLFSDNDDIIFSDSDIIFLKNPFDAIPANYEHAGYFDENSKIGGEINHVSGQLNFIKGWLWNKYIEGGIETYKELRKVLDKYDYSIADDSIFSVFAHKNKVKQYRFNNDEYWMHYKIKNDEEYEYYLNLNQ